MTSNIYSQKHLTGASVLFFGYVAYDTRQSFRHLMLNLLKSVNVNTVNLALEYVSYFPFVSKNFWLNVLNCL